MAPPHRLLPLLRVHQLHVFRIYFRNHQRDKRIHPVIPRVADHVVPGRSKSPFRVPCSGRVQHRKNHVRRTARFQRFQLPVGNAIRNFSRQPPRQFSIPVSRRTLACGQPRGLKPRMVLEKRNQLLPHHTRRAKHTYFDFGRQRLRDERITLSPPQVHHTGPLPRASSSQK
jgi:hypothetical protein